MFESVEFWELVIAVMVGVAGLKLLDFIGGLVWIKLFGK